MSVRCRLVRSDGSRWHVKQLRDVEDGFRVDAVPNGDGGPAAASSRGNGDGPGRLEDEPVLRGDRIEWVAGDGEVLWSMKMPVDAERSARDGRPAAARG